MLLFKIPGQTVRQGIVMVSGRRVCRHSGGFIDNEKIFVFVNNIQRQRDGKDVAGDLGFPDMDGSGSHRRLNVHSYVESSH